ECAALAGVDRFDLDAAANDDNAVAPRWYTREDDGLLQPWFGRVWCNPPYSDIRPWVDKAFHEHVHSSVLTVAMLLPANRTEQSWWQDLIEGPRRFGSIRVFFLRGRRRFERPGWSKPAKGDRPPFGLCLVVWGAA